MKIFKAHKKKFIAAIAGLLLVLIVALGSALLIRFIQRTQYSNEVKTLLTQVKTSMTNAKQANGGYVQQIPDSLMHSNDVSLDGGGDFDGTNYCVTGLSKKDPAIVYHIDNSITKPEVGSCANAAEAAVLPPESISVALVSSDTIRLSWVAVPGATEYTVQCATDASFNKNAVSVKSSSETASCTGLNSGNKYYVHVRTVMGAKISSWAPTLSATTDMLSLAPQNLVLKAHSSTSVAYSWDSVNGATSYYVEWATDINFLKNLHSTTQITSSGMANSLSPNTTYWFHVKAITPNFDQKAAAFSGELSVTTPAK